MFRKDQGLSAGGACMYAQNEYETRRMNSFGDGDEVDNVSINSDVRKSKFLVIEAIHRPLITSDQYFRQQDTYVMEI